MFCACRGEFLVSSFFVASTRCSYDSILQANHFMGVTTSCVFCLSKDIEKSSTTSICGLLSNLFDVSLHSSLSLVPLLTVLLSFLLPLVTPSLHFCCYYLNLAYPNNSLTSLAVHTEENIPFYSRFNGGINQRDKRKGKGFTARVSSGKGNLKANNCMSVCTSSPEALLLVWVGCGLVGYKV